MNTISSQAYTTMFREIKYNKQYYIEEEHYLTLYENKLTTASQQFLLENVHDVSYKPLSAQYGFLYLHTNKGCFSYQVKSNPSSFIESFKKLK